MPVIGRLDEQVNDVLIDPVGERRPPDDARATTNDTRTGVADKAGGAARDADDEKPRTRPDGSQPRARGEGQLPVWLL